MTGCVCAQLHTHTHTTTSRSSCVTVQQHTLKHMCVAYAPTVCDRRSGLFGSGRSTCNHAGRDDFSSRALSIGAQASRTRASVHARLSHLACETVCVCECVGLPCVDSVSVSSVWFGRSPGTVQIRTIHPRSTFTVQRLKASIAYSYVRLCFAYLQCAYAFATRQFVF